MMIEWDNDGVASLHWDRSVPHLVLLNRQVLYESALHLGSSLLYYIFLVKASNPELFSDRVVCFYMCLQLGLKVLKDSPKPEMPTS